MTWSNIYIGREITDALAFGSFDLPLSPLPRKLSKSRNGGKTGAENIRPSEGGGSITIYKTARRAEAGRGWGSRHSEADGGRGIDTEAEDEEICLDGVPSADT